MLLLLLAACTTRPAQPGADAPLLDGLRTLGRADLHAGDPERLVVVIRDRHAVHGSITRTRGRLWRVQRENHAAVRFLIIKGFRLLGAEAALGPLPDDAIAKAHVEAVKEALADGSDLDRLTVYQPLRYAVQYPRSLTVLGVEDPELYGSDTRSLAELVQLTRRLRRADLPPGEAERLQARRAVLLADVRSHAAPRGRAAARNLLRLMREREFPRAILLIGGAHVPALLPELRAAGASVIVFECPAYRG